MIVGVQLLVEIELNLSSKLIDLIVFYVFNSHFIGQC